MHFLICEFWQLQEIWSSATYDRPLILHWVQKTGRAYQKSVKKPGQKLIILPANENHTRIIMM
jgi:hypothetical protein